MLYLILPLFSLLISACATDIKGERCTNHIIDVCPVGHLDCGVNSEGCQQCQCTATFR